MTLYGPVTIGRLELRGNLFLAPVAGYTDRAFRSLCVEKGADFTYTELLSAEAVIRGRARDSLVRRGEKEERYGIQLFGADPSALYQAAALVAAAYRPGVIDLNAGCPVPKVVKSGAGSALMKNPALLGRLVDALVRASREYAGNAPVTVKIRSGWDGASVNYRECARAACESGAALVCLHPRTRSQGYEGKSDWSHIRDLVSRLPVPVAGSGDLFCPEDAGRMLAETGCAAVLFARGALGNPFIFSATRAFLQLQEYTAPSVAERLETGLRHLRLLAADIGERSACLEMRKHFCAYTRGLPCGAALRNKIVRAASIETYEALLSPPPPSPTASAWPPRLRRF
jgi:nifR3 family TIM-barrel protein